MKNVHSLPVTVIYAKGEFDFPAPRVCIGEDALLEKIRLGLPSIVYRKIGELFGDSLHGFCIKHCIYNDLTLEKGSFLYIQTTLDVESSFTLEHTFTEWWIDYTLENNIDFSDCPTICVEFVGSC